MMYPSIYVIPYYSYNIYCVACTSASATSTAIPASALSLSDVAEESCCWALLRMSLAAELSRFSTGWASSARIYRRTTNWFRIQWTSYIELIEETLIRTCTLLSSLIVTVPDETKIFLAEPSSS